MGATENNETASVAAEQRLSFWEKFGYGLGDTASNFYWKLFESFQLYFYTDVFGIGPAYAATMFFVTKIWDAINDPMIGFLSDRTRTAWGRFRPYLIWMSLPFAITGIMTFYTPNLPDTGKLVYAYVTYTLVFMAYTAINIPYGALMGVISPNSEERTSVSTFRFVLAFLGGLIVQVFTQPMVEYFGGGKQEVIVQGVKKQVVENPQAGFFWTVVVYAVAAVVLFLITFLTTKERVQPTQEKTNSFATDLADLSRNLPWLILLFVGLFQILAGWTRGSATAYYFEYYVEAEKFEWASLNQAIAWLDVQVWPLTWLSGLLEMVNNIITNPGNFGNFLAAGTFASIVGMFFTKSIVKSIGKKHAMIAAMLGNATCMACFLVLPKNEWMLMYLIHMLGSFVSGPMPILLWAMYADVADYSEWTNGRRATGLTFAAATFAQKMGSALGAAIPGWALAYYQFAKPVDDVPQIQSEQTITGIISMMSVWPAVFLGAACAFMAFYNLNDSFVGRIGADLAARRSTENR